MIQQNSWFGRFRDPALEDQFRAAIFAKVQGTIRTVLKISSLGFLFGCLLHSISGDQHYPAVVDLFRAAIAGIFAISIVFVNLIVHPRTGVQILTAALGIVGGTILLLTHQIPQPYLHHCLTLGVLHCIFSSFMTINLGRKFLLIGSFVLIYFVVLGVRPIAFQEWMVTTMVYSFTIALCIGVGAALDYYERFVFLLQIEVQEAKQRSENLLYQIMPRSVAKQLEQGDPPDQLVHHSDQVAVLFADLVGFTSWSSNQSPQEVVQLLGTLFSRFDQQLTMHQVEKIKTIGDGYMAVSGLPLPVEDCARQIAELALELREAVKKFSLLMDIPLQMRIGIHIGPVVAGVIGKERPHYDLWGDTVNTAARMEASGLGGEIQTSRQFMELLQDHYEFSTRGIMEIAGKGPTEVFILRGPKLPVQHGHAPAFSPEAA